MTCADYTVEFDISQQLFEKWTVKCYNNWCISQRRDCGLVYHSKVEAFRDWLQSEMEQRLSKLPDLGYEDEPVEHVKIAITCFAFRNAELIRLLRERGVIIKQEKWDKIEVIDRKINDLKNNHLEDLTTPCSAFMTFQCEEGYNRATRIDEAINNDPALKPLTIWLDDYTLDIKQACEPTDIIWENRHFTAL